MVLGLGRVFRRLAFSDNGNVTGAHLTGEFQWSSQRLGVDGGVQELSEAGCGGVPAECFTWPVVEFGSDCCEVFRCVNVEVAALGEVVTEETVRVLVRSALPGRVRVTNVDFHPGLSGNFGVKQLKAK